MQLILLSTGHIVGLERFVLYLREFGQ
uniref:Uncharacterized protein n=1 Tax=Anguilla anguilla TaxID=7936 RepID=A0A0E9P556_ANGAN